MGTDAPLDGFTDAPKDPLDVSTDALRRDPLDVSGMDGARSRSINVKGRSNGIDGQMVLRAKNLDEEIKTEITEIEIEPFQPQFNRNNVKKNLTAIKQLNNLKRNKNQNKKPQKLQKAQDDEKAQDDIYIY